jgi:hypothetical protein
MIEGAGSVPLTHGCGGGGEEAKKHADPADPDPNPQHCILGFAVLCSEYSYSPTDIINKDRGRFVIPTGFFPVNP